MKQFVLVLVWAWLYAPLAVQAQILPTPVLLSPASNATGLSGNVTLTWQAVIGADQYKVSVSTPNHSNDVAWDSSYVGKNYTLNNLPNGTYLWRIKAKHAANPYQSSAWTTTSQFIVGPSGGVVVPVIQPVVIPTMATPVLQYPTHKSAFQVLGSTLSWQSVAGATFYKVQVSTNAAMTNVVFADNNVAALSRVAQNLAYATTYYWTVEAANATASGPVSIVHQFMTMPDNPNTLTTHPRLLITQADLPRLRNWANPTNPVYAAMQTALSGAISTYNTQFFPGGQANPNWPDTGSLSWTPYVTEAYSEYFAFWSLIDPVVANRPIHAQRARNLIMFLIDQALPGAAPGVPFRDPVFMTQERGNEHGEQIFLTVDWIYNANDANGNAILTTADKVKIRTVFMRWCNEQLTGYNHPTPIGPINDKAITLTNRFVMNNFFAGHFRNMTLMTLSMDASDDVPLNPTLHYSAIGNSLRSYIYNATGAWLYQLYAQYEIPAIVAADYGVSPNGLGSGSGGFSPESSLYGLSFASLAQSLLVLKTNGWADETIIGKQARFLTSNYWTKVMDGYLHVMAPAPKVFAPVSYMGPIYQVASYGDVLRTWMTPEFVDVVAAIGLIDQALGNNQVRLDKTRWFARNAIEGGSANLARRISNIWGNGYATQSINYFLLLDPAGSNPPDPRLTMNTVFIDPALNKIYARTDWTANATWFNWHCGWTSINHQNGDGNQFELYRKGEWLTKERSGYSADGVGYTSEFHNTLGLQNNVPAQISWFEPACVQRGGQWTYGLNAGDPSVVYSMAPTYVYATGDATNLYNSPPAVMDITYASRSIVWLKPDHIIVYDRAKSQTNNRFKRFFLQFTALPVVAGRKLTVSTPGGQKVFLSNLLPATAVLTPSVSEAINNVAQLEPTTHKIKIEDPANPINVRFLNVIQGADGTASPDGTTLVQSSAGDAFEGAVVSNTAVLFPNVWGATFLTTTYAIPWGITTQLITGLVPNAGYDVVNQVIGSTRTVTINPGSQLTADAGGVLMVVTPAGGRKATSQEPVLTLSLWAAPNPASEFTTLRYALPEAALVTLDVYDTQGRRVATLVDNEPHEAGKHEVILPINKLGSGLYISKLTTGLRQVDLKIIVP